MLKNIIDDLIRTKNKRKSDNLERDIRIILEYFGFGEEIDPKQESIGKIEGLQRQYVSKDIVSHSPLFRPSRICQIYSQNH